MKPVAQNFHTAFGSLKNSAFSLVEILVVLAILGVMSALLVPALSGVNKARSLENASANIMGTLEAARGYAMSHNTYVWVGFESPTESADDLVIGVVASSSGDASPEPPDIVQIARMKRLKNIQLAALELDANRPSPEAQIANTTATTLQFAIAQPHNVTFDSHVIQFNNRGEMRVTNSLMRNIEIGLQESVNGIIRNPANYAAIQVHGLSGAVSLYRP